MKQHSGMLFCNSPRNARYLYQSLLDANPKPVRPKPCTDDAFSSCLIFDKWQIRVIKSTNRISPGGNTLPSETTKQHKVIPQHNDERLAGGGVIQEILQWLATNASELLFHITSWILSPNFCSVKQGNYNQPHFTLNQRVPVSRLFRLQFRNLRLPPSNLPPERTPHEGFVF